MSYIEQELLAEKNPLYGRATGILKMNPMTYTTASEFFPHFNPIDQITTFAILGGIPHYLAQFDSRISLEKNIKQHILAKGCTLYSEVEFLLHQELRETSVYNSIIQAIALGASSLNEIASHAMIDSKKVSTYLKNLMKLGLIEREFSVGASIKEQSKSSRGLYRIADEFFRFWYAFVFPNKSELEMFDVEGVYCFDIAPKLNEFASLTFEDVCRAWLHRQNLESSLLCRYGEIGRYWSKQCEIDAVGISKAQGARKAGAIKLFGECKFTNQPIGLSVLAELVSKIDTFEFTQHECYLFSKEGFTEELRAQAEVTDCLHLVEASELYQ